MSNILIADDSQDLLDLFTHIYRRRKINVSTVTSTEGLWGHLKNMKPDLIVLDIMLKGADGLEVCKELKSTEQYQNIPVILMTGNPLKLKQYKDFDADDILEKPFNIETILSKLKAFIKTD